MLEDMIMITSLRKKHVSRAAAYYQRCRHFIASGHKPVCIHGCRVCDGFRRYAEVMKFYSLRDSTTRPERKLNISGYYKGFSF